MRASSSSGKLFVCTDKVFAIRAGVASASSECAKIIFAGSPHTPNPLQAPAVAVSAVCWDRQVMRVYYLASGREIAVCRTWKQNHNKNGLAYSELAPIMPIGLVSIATETKHNIV